MFLDRTQRIINHVVQTSDVPFDWTLNPYRGCEHGCIYCFARPYHEYLGFSCGLDFETKLMAKPDAPALLVQELASPSWKPEPIVMSAITDIYQPIEHKMRIARQCLEVLADCGQPVTTMTKSALVLRDTDLWSRLAEMNAGRVTITLVTLDAELAQKLEPRASSPAGRLRAIRELTAAGVPVSVNVAPIIPGLTDVELPQNSGGGSRSGRAPGGMGAAAAAISAQGFISRLAHAVGASRPRKENRIAPPSDPRRKTLRSILCQTSPRPRTNRRTTRPDIRRLHAKVRPEPRHPPAVGGPLPTPHDQRANVVVLSDMKKPTDCHPLVLMLGSTVRASVREIRNAREFSHHFGHAIVM